MTAVELESNALLIGGEQVPAASGESLSMIDPCNGETFARIAAGGAEDIDRAVRAAQAALDGDWGRTPPVERSRIMQRWARLIMDNFEELSMIESRDTGKPLTAGRADITATARYFEFYAGAADKLHGQVIPYLDGYSVNVMRVPYGVTGHIIPWNYPAQQYARTVAAAIAVGNCRITSRCAERRNRSRGTGRRCAFGASWRQLHQLYRFTRSRDVGAAGSGTQPYWLHIGTGWQVTAGRFCRRQPRNGIAGGGQSHHPACRPDLFSR
jgi:hypothetical protein